MYSTKPSVLALFSRDLIFASKASNNFSDDFTLSVLHYLRFGDLGATSLDAILYTRPIRSEA